jgi:hypothetical protein
LELSQVNEVQLQKDIVKIILRSSNVAIDFETGYEYETGYLESQLKWTKAEINAIYFFPK